MSLQYSSMKRYELLEANALLLPTKDEFDDAPTGTSKHGLIKSQCGWLNFNFLTIKLFCTFGAMLSVSLLIFHYILLQSYKDEIGNAFGKSFTDTSADTNSLPKAFVRDATTSKLDCRRVIQNDVDYVKEMAKQRITYQDPPDLPMDCQSIKVRNYFPGKPNSAQESEFPLAQARVVYKDYRFLEMELAAGYAPQNWYCFAIDEKADKQFHERVHALASCLPNILITVHEYSVNSEGANMVNSFMECLKLLASPTVDQLNRQWRYVSLLQNHDVTVRTNEEAIQIFQWLNGANDVEMREPPAGRVNIDLDWSFDTIHIFQNASKYQEVTNGVMPRLTFAKGYMQASFSRKAVDYILEELDLTELISREEKQGFGNDEIVLPTINAADALDLPGGFTHNCIERDERVKHITRMSSWFDENSCGSKHMRHSMCVFGLEDLNLWLAHLPHLFANKLLPEFDFGAVDCWYEEMFHRSYLETQHISRLNATLYQTMPQVRFQTFKANALARGATLTPTVLNTFDCTTGSMVD